MTHTPGPWIAHGAVINHEGEGVEFPIATMTSLLPTGERNANARLIAAAPELLAVLTNILMYHDTGKTETRWTEKDGIAEPSKLANHDYASALIARINQETPAEAQP